MHKLKLFSLLFALLSITFLGCDDDDDTEPSRTDLLTSDTWRGDQILVNGSDASTSPLFRDVVPDAKTIRLKFNNDGTYTATFDLAGQTRNTSGTWEFTEDEQKISGGLLGLSSDAEIETLTDSNLNISTTMNVQGVPFPLLVKVKLIR